MKNIQTFEEFINEKKYEYPSFQSNKGIHYQDMLISKGYWTYMGKERFGKGLYMNIDNRQTYGFGPDDIEYFKKHLKDIEVMESSVNEARNTIGLAFKDEDEYKDFKEFAEDNGAKIYKDKGFDSKTKSWYIEMEESQLAHIYGDIQPGNKNSGWMAIKDDFESVIVS